MLQPFFVCYDLSSASGGARRGASFVASSAGTSGIAIAVGVVFSALYSRSGAPVCLIIVLWRVVVVFPDILFSSFFILWPIALLFLSWTCSRLVGFPVSYMESRRLLFIRTCCIFRGLVSEIALRYFFDSSCRGTCCGASRRCGENSVRGNVSGRTIRG